MARDTTRVREIREYVAAYSLPYTRASRCLSLEPRSRVRVYMGAERVGCPLNKSSPVEMYLGEPSPHFKVLMRSHTPWSPYSSDYDHMEPTMYDPQGALFCQAVSQARGNPNLPRARGATPRLFPNVRSLQRPTTRPDLHRPTAGDTASAEQLTTGVIHT